MPASTSPAVEDYLKTIYGHTEWQSEPITPSVLAGKLGVAPSSVTEMVKKMAAAGLVSHVPYGAVRLTPGGTTRALAVVRRHRLIETWLVREMGYAWDEVHDEAEVLEHALSDRLLEAIDARLGRPDRDPHGDPIPHADGTRVQAEAVLLSEASVAHVGRVVRISDRDPAVLRDLVEVGVGLDTVLTLTEATPDAVTVELDPASLASAAAAGRADAPGPAPVASAPLHLPRSHADAIWVTA
ncbi:metal-dependent transcriptional regulator [Agromyces mangrovi Wang et al. 2018]|uniref:metal-dependent transcriptional regulator n=1 Tax=Agromyces mangrovi TaxID=1858653 RepID=UPI002573B4C2|nr:metal-dependent transcriptional regulator [Agromyces mangrovi]BDZ64356.1 transcriptional regulator [Agromyces mangrovi]